MKTIIVRKAENVKDYFEIVKRFEFTEDEVIIEKVIFLSKNDFDDVKINFHKNRQFISDNLDKMFYDDNTKVWHCVAIVSGGIMDSGSAILIESEAYDYLRYTAVIDKSLLLKNITVNTQISHEYEVTNAYD